MRRTTAIGLAKALLCCAGFVLYAPVAFAQTSVTLEAAMKRARGDTADARALAAVIGEADGGIRRAASEFWPRVDITETVQRGNHPVFAFSSLLAQRRFTAASFAVPRLNDPDPVTNTRTGIEISHTLFNWGSTALGVKAARFRRDAAVAARDAGEQDLAFGAASAFVRVLQLEAEVRATEAAVAAAESDRQRARARRDVGLVTEADVLAVDVHLADMHQRRIAADGELSVARIRLAEAIGLPLTESLTLARPGPPSPPADAETLVRQALASHPLRRQADLEVQLADNARRAARAALLPAVGLNGGWEFDGATLGSQRSSWVIGAEIRMNVFRGFSDAARITEAGYAHSRATAERERIDRRVEVEVRAALAQLEAARARDEAGRAALAQARESQRIIRDRYESGLATVTDVLRAAEAALDAASRATAAETDVILRTVALDRAVGRL